MSKKAFVFAGQGSQFPGMGKDLYESSDAAKKIFEKGNELLGFDIAEVMFYGTAEDLKQTSVTQPALYIHAIAQVEASKHTFKPDGVAGHSLGEFSALVSAGVLNFSDGLKLVETRANAMQKACDQVPGTMAAILAMDDVAVEKICADIEGVVVAANYNCPGQLVISGELSAVKEACEVCKNAGAKRALLLPVGGAFHSPLMASAQDELASQINTLIFSTPTCPIYQNISAIGETNPEKIKENLIAQLTGAVRWAQSIQAMSDDGFDSFVEVGGNGKVLSGLIKKINRELETSPIM